jgi:hypothetical protein
MIYNVITTKRKQKIVCKLMVIHSPLRLLLNLFSGGVSEDFNDEDISKHLHPTASDMTLLDADASNIEDKQVRLFLSLCLCPFGPDRKELTQPPYHFSHHKF